MEFVLNFLISYIAGNIPTIKEYLASDRSVNKALRKCFNNAVEKWDVIEEFKESTKGNYEKFLSDLSEYLTHSPKGRHPKQNELLILWANEIKNDPTASSFVTQIQQDLDLTISQETKNIVTSINQEQQNIQAELQTIQQFVSPFHGDGIKTINEYWNYWATGNNFILHSDLVLAERTEQISEIVNSAFSPGVYNVRASSISEAIAFVCASLLLSNEDSFKNAYVVTKECTYERIMATEPSGLIIITDLNVNHNVASHKGNVIFYCELKKGKGLPELSPEAFTKAIDKSLSNNIEAYNLARQGGYDVVSLRRILGIEKTIPNWINNQNLQIIILMSILGEWDEAFNGDKVIIESLSNLMYDEFISHIYLLLNVDNSPIIKIGTIWKIKSPLDLFSVILNEITDFHIEKLQQQIPYLSIDSDPEAIEKLEETTFRFHTNRQMISSSLKHGIYRSMAILKDIFEHEDLDKSEKIKKIVAEELSSYDLKQYLSNRQFIIYFAAINPKALLEFIINDIQKGGEILDALFKGRKKDLSLTGWGINYTELIHALECIALDSQFIYEVTYILFYAMRFPKVGNYVDSVRDLLGRIYQLAHPQTDATFNERFNVLVQLKPIYPKEVFWISCHMIDSITEPHSFFISKGFPTQIYRHKKEDDTISVGDIKRVLSFIPKVYSFTEDQYLKCLNIAMCRKLINLTAPLINFLIEESVSFKKNVKIIDELEKGILHHERYKDAVWALSEVELMPFKDIVKTLCSDDILLLNRKFFCRKLPIQLDFPSPKNFAEYVTQSRILRGLKIKEIIESLGIERVWAFAQTVENPQSIFEGLSTLTNPDYYHEIYAALITNKIEISNACVYFSLIYYRIGEIEYLNIIDKLYNFDNSRISVPLYAPSWTATLSKKAKELGSDVNYDYWMNVNIWQRPEQNLLESVILNLLESKREWDIIYLIKDEEYVKEVSVELKIRILKGAIFNLREKSSHVDFYDFNKVLLSIGDEELQRTEIENDVLEIEGLLFHTLNEHLDKGEELHIVRALKWNAHLIIDLLKSYAQLNVQDSFVGFEYLYKFVNEVKFIICQHEDGTIDFNRVINYLSILINCTDLPLRYVLIGNLLYSIMITENGPSKEFCRVIESLANDDVDQHLYLAISKSRGVTWRGCFHGGQQERNLADHYAKMAKKVLPYSFRLKKVFDSLERSYLTDAQRMDEEALRNKYR